MHQPPVYAEDHSSLQSYLESVGKWVLSETLSRIDGHQPVAHLQTLMRDYPLRGGKRFRPALVLLCCELCGGDPQKAIVSATAYELFHNFALIHDDIEDESETRRGTPALHRQHGIPLALNAGDALLGLVHETLLENRTLLGEHVSGRVLQHLILVMRKTFEGQAMDIGWVRDGVFPRRQEFWAMIERKTGWYSGRGPCQCGGLITGAPESKLDVLGRFGEALGTGFQIRDDVLNLTESSEQYAPNGIRGGYGKERGGDLAEGKRTLIILEMLERLPGDDADRVRKLLLQPREQVGLLEIEWCIEQAHLSGALDEVQEVARKQAKTAGLELAQFADGPARILLMQLLDFLTLQRTM